MIFFSNKNRPYEMGPYPLERLRHDMGVVEMETIAVRKPRPADLEPDQKSHFSIAVDKYHGVFSKLGVVDPLPAAAPVPEDLARRTMDVKGAVLFLDASMVGISQMPESAWYESAPVLPHSHAVTIVVAHGRVPEPGNLAYDWVHGQAEMAANLRAYEIAIAIAEHIQVMGFSAAAHDRYKGDADVDRLTVLAGLGVRTGDGVRNPYLGDGYAAAVVTTDYQLAIDTPLASNVKRAKGLAYWLGFGGSVPGIEWNRRAKRASHLSAYPLEQVRRVDRPTTVIIDDEVPQVSKRAEFFERAARGDLGEKSKIERSRFSFKHPFAQAMVSLIQSMVPLQDGTAAPEPETGYDDPAANARAIKSLSYFLGAEMTGICEIPRYAWYSHRKNGTAIEPYNKYAIVMLIDQGFETMEGASGDDFISGAQSMRAYMRGAEIAGTMGEMLRAMGFHSRSQTNADSEVVHIPLVMWAGLGELSRIGELVLNPFIGPRMKTVILTTNFPLEIDKPIDFGLQYFCGNCLKCARECPCDAISWGDKVMFNGYEIWKPDSERCTRYRLTNQRGLACGRCMKTCPLNKVVTWEGPLATRIASWFGVNAFWAKPILVPIAVWLDDFLGNGIRNPMKKWWLDLEIVDGVCVEPRKGVNQRDLDLDHKIDPAKQKIAYYHAEAMPPPNTGQPFPVDRKAALRAAEVIETPLEALARVAKGGAAPAHYTPTPPLDQADEGPLDSANAIWDRAIDATKKEAKTSPD